MLNPWYYMSEITDYEALLFHYVICRHNDCCHYQPVAVAKEAQCGIKYRFMCIVYPLCSPYFCSDFVILEIYKPTYGAPYLTNQYKICTDLYD